MTMVEPGSRVFLEDLRSQLTDRLAIFLMASSALLLWLSMIQRPFLLVFFALLAALLTLGIATRSLLSSSPVAARHLLVWGLCAGLVIAMYLFPDTWLPFIGLPLTFVGALLVSGGGLATAGIVAAAAVWLATTLERAYTTPGIVIVLAVAVVVAWLAVRTVYTALEWAYTMQQRADGLLEVARDRQGELNRVLKSLDMANTLLRRTQGELVGARKHAEEAQLMKEQFAANISHELRTPLNLILGFSEVMYLSPETYGPMQWPPKLRRSVHQIYHNSRHLSQMIDDILDLSRFEIAGYTLNRETTPLSQLLMETVTMVSDMFAGSPVRLETDIPDNLPALILDRTRIRQVLLNLLRNAHRFTEQGYVRVSARVESDQITISVSDTGPGIPADKQSRIFEEFYQADTSLRRKHGGVGLGLAISKRFVEAHGGRIGVESHDGAGSTFFFTLPLIADPVLVASPHMEDQAEKSAPLTRPTLMVVEQDSTVVSLIRRNIEEMDVVQIEDASGVEEKVKLYHPHAVIFNLPPGEHADMARLALPVPVIECSLPSQSWVASRLAVRSCLTKPVSASQLLHEVERVGNVHNVLVIDDERGFCQLVTAMLQEPAPDLHVRHAYDGVEGLRSMHARKPDLVFLDLVMPEMDGLRVLETMRSQPQLADVPVVLVTATSYVADTLSQIGKQLTVRRADGLSTAEVLRCLHALAALLQPHYDEQAVPQEAMASRDT